MEPPKFRPPVITKTALDTLLEQRRAESEKHNDAHASAALGAVKCAQLNRELVLARVAVADEFLRARIEVLLGTPDTFFERRGCWLV
jgi:hypothetical protein